MIIKPTGKDMTNTDLSDFMLQHHAVFKKETATTYKCLKDRFHQISPGATISNQMLNCYLTLVPSAARVKIVELDGKGEE